MPPPGYPPPDRVPHDVHRGGLWLRLHRSDGDCILQVPVAFATLRPAATRRNIDVKKETPSAWSPDARVMGDLPA
jgi:hypothetical protein